MWCHFVRFFKNTARILTQRTLRRRRVNVQVFSLFVENILQGVQEVSRYTFLCYVFAKMVLLMYWDILGKSGKSWLQQDDFLRSKHGKLHIEKWPLMAMLKWKSQQMCSFWQFQFRLFHHRSPNQDIAISLKKGGYWEIVKYCRALLFKWE